MYKFERGQEQISKQADAVTRQHAIPMDVKKYAIEVQMRLSEKVRPGVGRKNQPTLADIYERLVNEGLKVVNADPIFSMIVEETALVPVWGADDPPPPDNVVPLFAASTCL